MTRKPRSDRARCHLGWRLIIFCGCLQIAVAEPVVVFLKNGDRLTGDVVSQNEKRVVIKSAVTGRVPILRDQIQKITPLSVVNAAPPATNPPPVAAAAPAPPPAAAAPSPPKTPPATPKPASVAAAPAPALLATNTPLSDPFLPGWFTGTFTNWHGNLQAGLNLGVGTTDRSTMYANATAAKKWGRTISTVEYHVMYGEANGIQNANQMAGATKVDVDLLNKRKLYAYGQGGAGYDLIRKIELEYLGGGGMGYKFIDVPNRVLAGELGLQYQVFNYSSGPDSATVAARLGENFTTKIEKLTITQRLGFTPGVADLSNYQVNFGLTLSYPLYKAMTLNFNLINQYFSQPAPGTQNNDLQIQTTIGVTF